MKLSKKSSRFLTFVSITFLLSAAILAYYWKKDVIVFLMLGTFIVLLVIALGIVTKNSRFTEWYAEQREKNRYRDRLASQWRHIQWRLKKSSLRIKSIYNFPLLLVVGTNREAMDAVTRESDSTINLTKWVPDLPNWYLANEAYLIDLPETYLGANTSGAAQYRAFIKTLKGHRYENPSDGIILAIPYDELVNGGVAKAKIDEMLKPLTAMETSALPVYIVITGMEKIAGIARIIELLRATDLPKMLGKFVGPKDDIRDTFSFQRRQIENMKLAALEASPDSRSTLYDYSREIANVESGIESLKVDITQIDANRFTIAGVFYTARYSEAPGNDANKTKSVFISDLLTTALRTKSYDNNVADRRSKQRLRDSLVASAFIVAISLVIAAYVENNNRIDEISQHLKADNADSIDGLYTLQSNIKDVSSTGYISRLSFVDAIDQIKKLYVERVASTVIPDLRNAIEAAISVAIETENTPVLSGYLDAMAISIDAEEKNGSVIQVRSVTSSYLVNAIDSQKRSKVTAILDSYVEWSGPEQASNYSLMNTYLILSERIVKRFGSDLFLTFADSDGDTTDIHLYLQRAMERAANARRILNVLTRANVSDRSAITKQIELVSAYEVSVVENYINRTRYSASLDGKKFLKEILDDRSPYILAFGNIEEALPANDNGGANKERAVLMDTVQMFGRFNAPDYEKINSGDAPILEKLKNGSEEVLNRLSSNTDNVKSIEKKIYPFYKMFIDSTKEIAKVSYDQKASFELFRDSYKENIDLAFEAKNPINKANLALVKIEGLLEDSSGLLTPAVVKLLQKQTDDLLAITEGNAVEHINENWKEEVILPLSDETGWKKVESVTGENGKIWDFNKKYLSEFIVKKDGRYREKVKYGRKLRINDEILSLLNQRDMQNVGLKGSYKIRVQTLPTDVNKEALSRPYMTRVTINCASENIEITNENYPAHKNVEWKPEECGDVILEINIGKTRVERRYAGYYGLVEFLKEFRNGQRIFKSDDFVSQRDFLNQYQIKAITVNYKFDGVTDIVKYKPQMVTNLPMMVVDL